MQYNDTIIINLIAGACAGKSRRPYVNWDKVVEIFEPVIKMFAK